MSVSASKENPGKAAERSYFTGLTRENDYSADLGLQIHSIGGKSLSNGRMRELESVRGKVSSIMTPV